MRCDRVERRQFIGLLGGAGLAATGRARAQQRMPVIGVLGTTTEDAASYRLTRFKRGLAEAGFVDGTNVGFDYRWANDQYDRLPEMAADLVRSRVGLIATSGNNLSARAAQAATRRFPLSFKWELTLFDWVLSQASIVQAAISPELLGSPRT